MTKPQKTSAESLVAGQKRPQMVARREDNFFSRYANNILYESTVYDLKLIFGQSDLSEGTEIVKQHSAITIPWSLIKLAIYFLEINLAIHELYNGRVTIPPQQIPIPFPRPEPETAATDPKAEIASETANRIRDEFLASVQGE